jgi:hypothetical protein
MARRDELAIKEKEEREKKLKETDAKPICNNTDAAKKKKPLDAAIDSLTKTAQPKHKKQDDTKIVEES